MIGQPRPKRTRAIRVFHFFARALSTFHKFIPHPYLVVADPRHLHVVREDRLHPRDRRSVPPDDLDVLRAVFDFRCLAVCGGSGARD